MGVAGMFVIGMLALFLAGFVGYGLFLGVTTLGRIVAGLCRQILAR